MFTEQSSLKLAYWLAGEFSNYQQAADSPKDYPHIRVFFRPLSWDFFQGIGFYSEQVYDYDLWAPYRQGVHRFIQQDNQIYIENYSLKQALLYAGAGRERYLLEMITPGCIERRYNCSMIFVFQDENNLFRGKVEGQSCLITRNSCKTYLVSEVELTQNTFVSLDRGFDINTHQQVWGTTTGPLQFEKCQSFADEISNFVTFS